MDPMKFKNQNCFITNKDLVQWALSSSLFDKAFSIRSNVIGIYRYTFCIEFNQFILDLTLTYFTSFSKGFVPVFFNAPYQNCRYFLLITFSRLLPTFLSNIFSTDSSPTSPKQGFIIWHSPTSRKQSFYLIDGWKCHIHLSTQSFTFQITFFTRSIHEVLSKTEGSTVFKFKYSIKFKNQDS